MAEEKGTSRNGKEQQAKNRKKIIKWRKSQLAKGLPVDPTACSRATGLSRQTVYKHYAVIKAKEAEENERD